MKLVEIDKSQGIYGRRIYWRDPDKNDLIEVKVSPDNMKMYFVMKDAPTYMLEVSDIIEEVEKLIKKMK